MATRIRFDVRLGGSFAAIVRCTVCEVAKLSRLPVRPGTGSAPGRASRYCGRGRRDQLVATFSTAAGKRN